MKCIVFFIIFFVEGGVDDFLLDFLIISYRNKWGFFESRSLVCFVYWYVFDDFDVDGYIVGVRGIFLNKYVILVWETGVFSL